MSPFEAAFRKAVAADPTAGGITPQEIEAILAIVLALLQQFYPPTPAPTPAPVPAP